VRRAGARRARACESFSKRLGAFGGKCDFCARARTVDERHTRVPSTRGADSSGFLARPVPHTSRRARALAPIDARTAPVGAIVSARTPRLRASTRSGTRDLGARASGSPQGRGLPHPTEAGRIALARGRAPVSTRAPARAPRAPRERGRHAGCVPTPPPFLRARPPRASASTTRQPLSFNSPISTFSRRHLGDEAAGGRCRLDSSRPTWGASPTRRARFPPPNDSIRFGSARRAARPSPPPPPPLPRVERNIDRG
jgi:hypothetical protein